jgi:parvulin-like peptidyl-prolyl isomerase
MRILRLFLILTLLLSVVSSDYSQEVIDEIVAIVNDEIITLSEIRTEYEKNYQRLRAQYQGEELDKQVELVKKGLLDVMITTILLFQEADKLEIDIDERMKMWIDNLKKENNINSDEEFLRILSQQGIDYEEWKKGLRENMLREAVIVTEVQGNIAIDEAEIVSYYKLHPEEFTELPEFTLKAISLLSDSGNEEEIEAKKREINAKIEAGEDFGALASEHADGPEKEKNGDLGSFKKGELAKELEEPVENLKQGEVTPWIQFRNGWYLLKLVEKKEALLRPFDEIRGDIENKIFSEIAQEKYEEFMKELKAKNYIKILIPNPLDF